MKINVKKKKKTDNIFEKHIHIFAKYVGNSSQNLLV